MKKRLVVILGNMLYEDFSDLDINKENDLFFMAESYDLAAHFKYHKYKIILFFASMRNKKEEIEENFDIKYHKYEESEKLDFFEKIKLTLDKNKNIESIITYEIEDKFMQRKFAKFCKENNLKLEIKDSQNFLTSREDFNKYLNSYKRLFFNDFYIYQRKRLNILIDEFKKPIGGRWSFDDENRKKFPKDKIMPGLFNINFEKNKNVEEVKVLVDKYFKEHIGESEDFYLPTTNDEAKKWFEDFLKNKFFNFGAYEDSISQNEVFIFHSVLSPMINIGLINPGFIVKRSLEYAKEYNVPINSLEGFIRQLIGWREFIRGVYNTQEYKISTNYLNHNRDFRDEFLLGDTGIKPLDDSIKKALKHSYTHHIERLMILGNIMLLCEIHPSRVYKFFMEYFVDSSDWVMVPNVFGMSQFSDGGLFATKPYICSSNYILKMSDYKKDNWCDTLDALYWRFISKNPELFSKNPRMKMMLSIYDKKSEEEKKKIKDLSKEFLDKFTVEIK